MNAELTPCEYYPIPPKEWYQRNLPRPEPKMTPSETAELNELRRYKQHMEVACRIGTASELQKLAHDAQAWNKAYHEELKRFQDTADELIRVAKERDAALERVKVLENAISVGNL